MNICIKIFLKINLSSYFSGINAQESNYWVFSRVAASFYMSTNEKPSFSTSSIVFSVIFILGILIDV